MKNKRYANTPDAGISFPNGRNGIATRRRSRGFMRVEFLAVLAVAGTLAFSVVYASSGSSADRHQGARANAQLALSELATLQEQHFLNNKRYTDDLEAMGLAAASASTAGGHYALRVELPAGACPQGYCYVLSAVPQGQQTDDECGTLSLTSDGAKLPAGCW